MSNVNSEKIEELFHNTIILIVEKKWSESFLESKVMEISLTGANFNNLKTDGNLDEVKIRDGPWIL